MDTKTLDHNNYHQTALASYRAMYLDGGRYFTPCPKTDGVLFTEYHHWDLAYKYMVQGSPEYKLNLFFFDRDHEGEGNAQEDDLSLTEQLDKYRRQRELLAL